MSFFSFNHHTTNNPSFNQTHARTAPSSMITSFQMCESRTVTSAPMRTRRPTTLVLSSDPGPGVWVG